MSLLQPRNPTRTGTVIRAQEKDLRTVCMTRIETFKKEMSNSLKEIQKNTNEQCKEMNETVEDLKMEVELMKKTQTKGIQQNIRKERISDIEDLIEEVSTLVNKNVISKKNPDTKTSRKSGTL